MPRSAKDLEAILDELDPAKVSVDADGRIVIEDDNVRRKLEQLGPDNGSSIETAGIINIGGCNCGGSLV